MTFEQDQTDAGTTYEEDEGVSVTSIRPVGETADARRQRNVKLPLEVLGFPPKEAGDWSGEGGFEPPEAA